MVSFREYVAGYHGVASDFHSVHVQMDVALNDGQGHHYGNAGTEV